MDYFMSLSVAFTPDLHRRIAERTHLDGSFGEIFFRAVEARLDLGDGHTERGTAIAVLLHEIGTSARREAPRPDPRQLAEWLQMLNRISS